MKISHTPRPSRVIKTEVGRQGGFVLLKFALLLVPLLLMVGFSVDVGYWYNRTAAIQKAADAAALAGVVWLPDTGTAAGCHVIDGAAFRNMSTVWAASDYTATGCLQAAVGKGWCPTTRNEVQLTADTIGVYVRIRQDNMFGMIGDSLVIERNAAMRLEP